MPTCGLGCGVSVCPPAGQWGVDTAKGASLSGSKAEVGRVTAACPRSLAVTEMLVHRGPDPRAGGPSCLASPHLVSWTWCLGLAPTGSPKAHRSLLHVVCARVQGQRGQCKGPNPRQS